MRFVNFILVFLLPIKLFGAICVFNPPPHWQCTDPAALSKHIQIGFIGKSKHLFRPSINLATEDINISFNEYIQAVKKIHQADKNCHWRSLGKINTKAGPAHIAEIITETKFGTAKMLQLILVKDNHAYILTSAALKDEFTSFKKEFMEAFRSLRVAENLLDVIESPEKKENLRNDYQIFKTALAATTSQKKRKKLMDKFQKMVLKDYQELGAYWQILFLKEAYINFNQK